MATLLLLIIYIAFISLGIPDSLFGTGYYNYRNLVMKLFDYTKDMPEQLFLTGSSANDFRHTLIKYFKIEFL